MSPPRDVTDFSVPAWASGRRRRWLLLALVTGPALVASRFLAGVLPQQHGAALELAMVALFGVLFGWISIGLWTALAGALLLLTARDRYRLTALIPTPQPIADGCRTAVVMPIYREDISRCCAGLRATIESVRATGQVGRFEFFLLSDNPDPVGWAAEGAAWAALTRDLGPQVRLHYRRRHLNLRRKSGNLADFCRRWGAHFRYFVVLDADSVMSGDALVRLVNMMERNPGVGLIQTVPRPFGARSPFARLAAFAAHAYGRLYAAGQHFWQLGDGAYVGHNAIVRTQAFMRHCALPRLPGAPPLGGEILSHDFVESALLRRAGYAIWLAYDLDGSWEELPPNLLEALKRDRRWCQGNLQHMRLLLADGLFPAHRALFVTGMMAYVSALIWLGFLVLSSARAVAAALGTPDYFPGGPSLFPTWPVWRREWAMALVAVTGVILFAPKVLAVLVIVARGEARRFGGVLRLVASTVLEALGSVLLAPTLAVFHAWFVLRTLLGEQVGWGAQLRADAPVPWRVALRYHGAPTLIAALWGAVLLALDPRFFWWLAPVLAALVLALPLAVWSSRPALGSALARAGLLRTPAEAAPPPELRACTRYAALPTPADDLVAVVTDPRRCALQISLVGLAHGARRAAEGAALRDTLVEHAVAAGPQALGPRERTLLLRDAHLLARLHDAVWSAPPAQAARWGIGT
jgi:membrane glycosyltransferase